MTEAAGAMFETFRRQSFELMWKVGVITQEGLESVSSLRSFGCAALAVPGTTSRRLHSRMPKAISAANSLM